MFDVPDKKEIVHEWRVNVPVEERPWKIGLIVGPSGAGKTTLATELFPKAYLHEAFDWPAKASLLDAFPEHLSIKDITAALNAVGFSSPPHWLKTWHHLSNGQKFRAELARCLLMDVDTVVFDEFTSVVDRDVAKICSAAVAKTIRKRARPQLVAVSCHFDIIDWLQPDWMYDVAADRFEWRRLRRRPPVRLEIHQTTRRAWTLFRGHHYLSADLHQSARCYVAWWGERPVAFTAVLHQPNQKSRNRKREHRTVVLPDYQGVGIGNAVSAAIAQWHLDQGWKYSSVTSHPAMIRHRLKSAQWKLSRLSRAAPHRGLKGQERCASTGRLTASFEFVGHREKRVA